MNDDYSLKRTLKMKHVTPAGLAVTSKSEHQKGVNGALEAKFFHAKSGVMFDKAKVTSLTTKKRKNVYVRVSFFFACIVTRK